MNNTMRRESHYTHYTPLYSIHKIHDNDWELLIWFASLKKIENFINLFIVVWDSTSINYLPLSKRFASETNRLIGILKVFSNGTYHKTLSDYRDCRLNKDNKLRSNLV